MTRTSFRSALLAGERHLNMAVVGASALMLAIASAAGLYQVVSRFVFHSPATWSEPTIRVTLTWMVYLGLMAAARGGTMIAVGFLFDMSSGRLRDVMRLAIALCVLAMLGVLIYYGWIAVYMVRNQTIAGLGISASWAYSAIPVGAGFAALAAIAHYFDRGAPAQAH
jgi:TRAP-type C4-dicarboxylate transport system permease small subunit